MKVVESHSIPIILKAAQLSQRAISLGSFRKMAWEVVQAGYVNENDEEKVLVLV